MNKDARNDLALQYLKKPWDDLCEEEQRVLDHIVSEKITSRGVADMTEGDVPFGERLADQVARIGGSWSFIIGFTLVLLAWMLLNSSMFERLGITFDPFPYIFLNLLLSTLAAVQAPIIMMSQNRQAEKDRIGAAIDFETNLRAEIEVLRLHSKMDLMIHEHLHDIAEKQALILKKLEGS